jgi:hypothetical protein
MSKTTQKMKTMSIFMTVIASILLFIAIVFMMYVCGYLCNECMTHPIKIGIMQTNTDPENRNEPETITANALFADEKV